MSRLTLHYWYSRRVSTGISIIPLVILYIADLVYYIVSSAVAMEYVWIIVFVIAIISFIAIILKQLYLLSRPDFKLQPHKPSGLMYPSAVRFRLATVSESRSYKLDLKFDWRLRILVCRVVSIDAHNYRFRFSHSVFLASHLCLPSSPLASISTSCTDSGGSSITIPPFLLLSKLWQLYVAQSG